MSRSHSHVPISNYPLLLEWVKELVTIPSRTEIRIRLNAIDFNSKVEKVQHYL